MSSTTFATLDLGNPTDGKTWERGCQSLGMLPEGSVLANLPSIESLVRIFAGEPDWFYLSGHYAGLSLFSEQGVSIDFAPNQVTLTVGESTKVLRKGEEFKVHRYCSVVAWGGCSACSRGSDIRTIRSLFDNPTILGYSDSTGWKINDAMLGGGFIRKHFFANLGVGPLFTSKAVVRAWLTAAAAGYDKSMQKMFRAVDEDGQEWKLENGEVVLGRRF